jgi:hypothetical protein
MNFSSDLMTWDYCSDHAEVVTQENKDTLPGRHGWLMPASLPNRLKGQEPMSVTQLTHSLEPDSGCWMAPSTVISGSQSLRIFW